MIDREDMCSLGEEVERGDMQGTLWPRGWDGIGVWALGSVRASGESELSRMSYSAVYELPSAEYMRSYVSVNQPLCSS